MSTLELHDLGRLLSSSARAAMLQALMEGRALSAGELARCACVATSTASEHLAVLADAGLVTALVSGRHRYYRLAAVELAEALEALMRLTPLPAPRSLRASKEARSLGFARTCYDHLAGEVGVAVHDALLARRWLVLGADGYELTEVGGHGLAALQVDVQAARASRRPLARPCLDWTQRRHHLAGALAAELCRRLLAADWFRRHPTGRGLTLTAAGEQGLAQTLGVELGHHPEPANRPGDYGSWTTLRS